MTAKVIHVERTTSGTRGAVWALLDDSPSWVDWTPIDECEVTGARGQGRNEVRRVRNGRVRVTEEIVRRRPEQELAYTVLSGLAVRDYLAVITLHDVPGGTKIVWHTEFAAKVPGMGWLYLTALRRATNQFVDGLVAATSR
jgi:hypothetical protein